MNWKHLGAAGLTALALGLAALPAHAGKTDEAAAREDTAQARKDMERARREVEQARAELQRATRELARAVAQVERDNPRAQYFEYLTNPDRAVLGVLIPDPVDSGGETRGVRLLAVTPGGAAEKAGLKAGDLLLSLNGQSLARDGDTPPERRMKEAIKRLKAGDQARIEYERDGRRHTTTATTQAPEPEIAFTLPPLPQLNDWLHDESYAFGPMPLIPMFRGPAIRGLELARLDADLGQYFQTTEGVLVVKAPKSTGLELKSGDVIQRIDGDEVTEPVTVLDKLRSRADERTVRIDILRQGRKMTVEGKIPVADARPRPQVRRGRVDFAPPPPHADEQDRR